MDAPRLTRDRARRLRAEMDLPERLLWKRLNRRQLDGLRFRRQHPLGDNILDFYCDQAKLAVEIGGYSHGIADRPARDARRDDWVATRGVRTLRIAARGVLKSMEDVQATIAAAAKAPSVASRQLPQRGSDSASSPD
jgi:very-short-patch-repair endonuclease